MSPSIPRRPLLSIVVSAVLIVAALVTTGPGLASAADGPRRGGVLLAVIGADPPSLDAHQESTFANVELVAPLCSRVL